MRATQSLHCKMGFLEVRFFRFLLCAAMSSCFGSLSPTQRSMVLFEEMGRWEDPLTGLG